TLRGEAADLRPLELASGTSFGMCMGYCTTELTITEDQVTLSELGRPETLPARTRSLPLEPEDRARIGALVDRAQLARLEGVHGCPDCADGGAEWIELR